MIVLSNGLTRVADEGALNIASSLIRRIKRAQPDTTVITYERQAEESDLHLPINKFLLNGKLIRLIREKREPVLYVPFPTRMRPAALRMFILSRFARWGLKTLLVMNGEMDRLSALLVRLSGSEVLAVSRQTYEGYREKIGAQAVYVKTGVDTTKFCPVTPAQKAALRTKYGIPEDRPVVLHVGHLREGRNIGCMPALPDSWQVLLVVSSYMADSRDAAFRQRFVEAPNVRLIEDYVPQIQELYQLADVYLFPVTESGNCIDVPLSALEAAACGIPVAATAYGELRELLDEPGFYAVESPEPAALDVLLRRAAAERISPRQSVLDYDWQLTVSNLLL